MDQSSLLYAGLVLGAVTVLTLYALVVLISPELLVPHDSEKSYVSPSSPDTPQPLGRISDPPSIDLSVIIPAYNESKRLPDMLATTIAHLDSTPSRAPSPPPEGDVDIDVDLEPEHPPLSKPPPPLRRTYELIIVDDGSSDDTPSAALAFGREHPHVELRVVKLEHNVGKGGAVRHGMLHARGARLLMVDADGATRFADLEVLWRDMDIVLKRQGEQRLKDGEEGAAVVIGSRAHLVKTEAVVKRSLLRNILMYALHTLLRILGVGHIRDTQCGFKLFSRRAARALFPAQHLPGWAFDVELLLLARAAGVPVAEVPVAWHEVGGSKLNVVLDSVGMFRDLLLLKANFTLGRWGPTPSART
ncbi:glycosyltransferase family 2 protein [Gelatoporia subvermispora B]|uniref:dolichyl-phosphate beta-glucosyltransferase n=1 Tax=Ceriporiopsis subvermispora (strain B) TaxID=914234 RepID=M2RKP3_CERS8|nr:glycosyltransferase family 2 protein [Gelatoporia subvermispora B]